MAEERGLADMLARLAPTAAEVTAMGAALGEVAAWWPQGKRPAPKHVTLRDLSGFRGKDGSPEWGPLSALVAHVRAKRAPSPKRAPEPDPLRPYHHVPDVMPDLPEEILRRFKGGIA